jgi:hypothetical protein
MYLKCNSNVTPNKALNNIRCTIASLKLKSCKAIKNNAKKIVFKNIISALLFFSINFHFSQSNDSTDLLFKSTEEKLQIIEKGLLSKVEKERIETNKKFIAQWDQIVNNPKILSYQFDSLKEVSILTPKDKKFKLITWNLYKDDGTHAFFGYLLVNNSKKIKKGFFIQKPQQLNFLCLMIILIKTLL